MSLPVPTVRAAEPRDIEALTGFACAMAWETEHKRLDPDTVRRGIAAVFERAGRARYLVAESGGSPVGGLMLTYEWSDWRCADWWWIQSVYVIPEQRRNGVFRMLYAAVKAEAAADPAVCGIRLYVERDNQRAQATYAALGMVDAQYRVMEYVMPWVESIVHKDH